MWSSFRANDRLLSHLFPNPVLGALFPVFSFSRDSKISVPTCKSIPAPQESFLSSMPLVVTPIIFPSIWQVVYHSNRLETAHLVVLSPSFAEIWLKNRKPSTKCHQRYDARHKEKQYRSLLKARAVLSISFLFSLPGGRRRRVWLRRSLGLLRSDIVKGDSTFSQA